MSGATGAAGGGGEGAFSTSSATGTAGGALSIDDTGRAKAAALVRATTSAATSADPHACATTRMASAIDAARTFVALASASANATTRSAKTHVWRASRPRARGNASRRAASRAPSRRVARTPRPGPASPPTLSATCCLSSSLQPLPGSKWRSSSPRGPTTPALDPERAGASPHSRPLTFWKIIRRWTAQPLLSGPITPLIQPTFARGRPTRAAPSPHPQYTRSPSPPHPPRRRRGSDTRAVSERLHVCSRVSDDRVRWHPTRARRPSSRDLSHHKAGARAPQHEPRPAVPR